MKPETLLQIALSAAVEAGEAIMKIYTHPDLDWEVERKADNSPLTLADRRSHAVIAQALDMTPYPLLSEEGCHEDYAVRKQWETLWICDPLDGTKEFIKRNGEFTVNIALVKGGVPVMGVIYVPVSRTLFWGHTEAFNGQIAAWRCEVDERAASSDKRPYRSTMTPSGPTSWWLHAPTSLRRRKLSWPVSVKPTLASNYILRAVR